METVRVDTLPSTESNKLYPLLSTDARDSNDISKEKEEELLYGAGEDIDEDEALSDDSLRLKFSDDEGDQDDVGSAEHFDNQLKQEDTAKDKKFETSETSESFTITAKRLAEDNVKSGEKSVDQAKCVNDTKGIKSFIERSHDQDTRMNGNDPRFFSNLIRPNFDNRWRQNCPRPRMSFNNRSQHQRAYYQSSNFGPTESDLMNNRYYNKHSHYGRLRGSGKPHHQSYKEQSIWSNKSKSFERRKEPADLPASKNVDSIDNENVVQENIDSATELEKTELATINNLLEINSIKTEIDQTCEEGLYTDNGENEKENINDCPTNFESLAVKASFTEEATVPNAQNTLMETDVPEKLKESLSEKERRNSTETSLVTIEVDEAKLSDEYAHLNEDSGVLDNTPEDISLENVKACSSVEESNSKQYKVLQMEKTDFSKSGIPDDDPENYEGDQEDLGFETPTEEASSGKGVMLNALHIETMKDSAVEHSDAQISINDDSESAMENLPKVYQCLEEIASMEASRLARKMDEAASLEKSDNTRDITVECGEDVPMSSEKNILIGEDTSLQDDDGLNESEKLIESKLPLYNEERENSNMSMGSAETLVFGPPENIEERMKEVEKLNIDDNACQSNEDAKAGGPNKESILDGEDINYSHSPLILQTDLITKVNSNEVSNNVSTDVNNDVSNETSNNSSNVHVGIATRISKDESNSRNSLFTGKEDTEEKNSENSIKCVNQVAKLDESKISVDKNQFLDIKSGILPDKQAEACKVYNDGCSNVVLETSNSASLGMEVYVGNEDKTDSTTTVQRNKRGSSEALLETSEIFASSSAETKGSGRQKRKTAKNAEEIIRTKFLGNDSEIESDDSGNLVSVSYKSRLDLTAPSPPSLKRNLGDDGDDDSYENVTVKKIKMTLEPPKHLIKLLKEEDSKNKESIRNLSNVRKFFQRDVKGQLKKLKQEELEELLIQKIVETITMSSEIGKLREQARLSEKNQEATRARCQQLAKQIQDFEMVLKRNAADRSASNDKFVAPIKINRSVGLQVNFMSDHGMQNMRQIQQNTKSALANAVTALSSDSSSSSRRGIKVRSPRRAENIIVTGQTSALQSSIQASTPNPVAPAALVPTKPVEHSRTLPTSVQTVNQQQPTLPSLNVRSPNKLGSMQLTQQPQPSVILNGNIPNRNSNTTQINVQKPKSNDLIDLTDEEEKTKTTVNTPITVTTATIITNPQAQRAIMQSHSQTHQQYQRVIQTIPTSVAISNQGTNIRVVQPNSQSTPTALVNNINAPRLTYVMQSGGTPRQILIANPNSIRQGTSNRNHFSALTYKTANGIPTTANGTLRLLTTQAAPNFSSGKHPAPLPDSGPCETNPNWKLPPPAPSLKISKVSSGIVLSWNMSLSDKHADIVSYQLFAYQEVSGTPPSTRLWKKVGDVMALPLPMACTLTQFSAGNNYYFAVRAVDAHSRLGQYSVPGNISL